MKWLTTVLTVIALPIILVACDALEQEAPLSEQQQTRADNAVVTPAKSAGELPTAELIVAFDEAAGQLTEGIAVDKTGNIFVSATPLGQLWKISPGSDTPVLFGTVEGIDASAGDLGLIGLTADPAGNIYAGVQSANPAVNGVWVFDRKSGDATRIEGSESTGIANDVAFDKRGNLYITDSALGAIWRLPKHGQLEPWLVGDDNLAGTGVLGVGVPIGANGIEYRQGVLYVANTEKGMVVTVPVGNDGQPGTSSVLVDFPDVEVAPGEFLPSAADGLALDVFGNVYVAQVNLSTIVKVTPHGDVSVVYSGDPLDWTSSVKFGTSRGHQTTLFGVNYSIGEGFGDPVPRAGPGLVAIEVGVQGMPLP